MHSPLANVASAFKEPAISSPDAILGIGSPIAIVTLGEQQNEVGSVLSFDARLMNTLSITVCPFLDQRFAR